MLSKPTIALSVALSIGAASAALADVEYDGTGKPINMHLVEWNVPAGAFAATRARANVPIAQPGVPSAARASDQDRFIRFQLWRDSQWKTGG